MSHTTLRCHYHKNCNMLILNGIKKLESPWLKFLGIHFFFSGPWRVWSQQKAPHILEILLRWAETKHEKNLVMHSISCVAYLVCRSIQVHVYWTENIVDHKPPKHDAPDMFITSWTWTFKLIWSDSITLLHVHICTLELLIILNSIVIQ